MYFVRFPDNAIYCAGPQKDKDGSTVPGGPIGYEVKEDAEKMAAALRGTIENVSFSDAVYRCQKIGHVLWIKKPRGYAFVRETIPAEPKPLIRVEGLERQAALAASETRRPYDPTSILEA